MRASVLDISREKISDAAIIAKGVSSLSAFAMPMAMAVFPVPGCPASSTPLPAILPSLTICRITPAACTVKCELSGGTSDGSDHLLSFGR